MDKNITVENLVKLYDEDKTADKKNFYSQLKVEKYVPFLQKAEIAKKIVESTCLNDNGYIELNSPLKYMLYCRTVVDVYTNIKLSNKVEDELDDNAIGLLMVAEFDALNSRGLFETIFNKIPEKELNEFNTVMDMATNDIMANKYEPHAYFGNLVDRIANVINFIANVPDDVDTEAINEQIGDIDG